MKKYLLCTIFILTGILEINAQIPLLINGNFATSGSGWTASGDFYYGTAYPSCYVCPGYAYACGSTGLPTTYLDGYLEQSVTIPSTASSANLSFYADATISGTPTGVEHVFVYLYDYTTSSTYSVATIYLSSVTTYTPYSYSIPSSLYGHSLRLGFHAVGSSSATTIRVDEVNLSYIAPTCTSPSVSVNSPTGTGSALMVCTATGGSGGTINYEWYSGTSCSGTVLGTSSTLTVTSSGNYTCRAYISGYYSTCYNCSTGYATITSSCTSPSVSVNSPTGTGSALMVCTATGGSGGTINYEWYSGTSCSGTVLGTSSTLTVTMAAILSS